MSNNKNTTNGKASKESLRGSALGNLVQRNYF